MKCSTSPKAIRYLVEHGMEKDISNYIAQLEAKVERLTKAGDVMADFIHPSPTAEMWGEEPAIKQAWENAKEDTQS